MARTLAGAVGSNSVAVVEIVASSAFFSSSILLADGGDIGSSEEWWRCIKKLSEIDTRVEWLIYLNDFKEFMAMI